MDQKIIEKYKDKFINGKDIAYQIKIDLFDKIKKESIEKSLSAIIVGNNENSKKYVDLKNKFANDIGVEFNKYIIEENSDPEELIQCINFLNDDEYTDGIIIQLPLPKNFDKEKAFSTLSPEKDVDGFLDSSKFKPVMANVIMVLLNEVNRNFDNSTISIISNSEKSQEKISNTLREYYKDITIYNNTYSEKNIDLIKDNCKKSDIIISIVGKKHFINKDFIKKDCVIIDAGITRENDEVFGDADIEDVIDDVAFITPPIGGVGPLTVALLFKNLVG